MIQEDYVSFDLAKLLKEKGFDGECLSWYSTKGNLYNYADCFEIDLDGITELCSAPTLQMAMKWLREVHNLHIDIDPSEGDWNPTVLELEDWTCAVKFNDKIPIQDSYEKAVEAAIKYCLTKLI